MELFFILILVAVYVVVFVVKTLSSKADDVKGTPVMGDVFPKIEVYNESVNEYKPKEPVQQAVSRKKEPLRPARRVVVEKQPETTEKVADEDKSISLKKKSEARRAFIHAEILNRKY
ncbi:MAG: hypothetical protein J6V20_06860 [Bacteroidaceae bacterium]|nr:hypothetical protein [Bacteroidaceae bacterium]